MTATELISLLKQNEFGASGKPRNVNLSIPGYGFLAETNFTVNSTDDGLYTAICFDVEAKYLYREEQDGDGDD